MLVLLDHHPDVSPPALSNVGVAEPVSSPLPWRRSALDPEHRPWSGPLHRDVWRS
jgi:hypothetical protein